MTNEQIKQNAKAYAIKICEETPIDYSVVSDAYISGAHSRDEEVKELKEQRNNFKDRLLDALEKRDQLRNPWISVEERLPEEHSKVLIMFCNGTVTYNDYIGVGDINYMKAHSKTITHWMLIPELKKGE